MSIPTRIKERALYKVKTERINKPIVIQLVKDITKEFRLYYEAQLKDLSKRELKQISQLKDKVKKYKTGWECLQILKKRYKIE